MVVKTRPISKSSNSYPGIDLPNHWQRIKPSPCLSTPVKRGVMSGQKSVPERPETATLEKPSILDPNLSKKIDMTILSRENLKYVNNLVIKPIPKKASLEEQTLALSSLTAGLNTISGPNSLIISTNLEESNKSGLKKTSPFNPITLESPKSLESGTNMSNSTQASPASRPSRGKTVLHENKPKVVAQKKNSLEDTSSKLSKLYKAINKSYKIRTSFRRGKDKSNTSRSSSRCDVSNNEETPGTAKQVKPEVKNERAAHSGKSKKSGKKAGHKEKKFEHNVAQKSAVRKPFAAKFKGRSRSLKRSDESSAKSGKKESNKDRHVGEKVAGDSDRAAAGLKVPAKSERPETGGGNEMRKAASPSLSSHIPVRKGKTETAPVEPSGPTSLTVEDLHPVTRTLEKGYSLTEWIPVPPSSGRKPRLITCRYCSREFGTASFPVHEPRCMKAWLGEQNSNKENKTENCTSNNQTPSQSSSSPQKDSNNNGCRADKTHKTATRTKQGTPKPGTAKKRPGSVASEESLSLPVSVTSSPGTPSGRRPPTVLCHICNREFGSKSIAIHEPQCLHKRKMEQDRQNSRKQSTSGDRENKSVQDTLSDDTFWESHRQQLVPCKKCSRTFNPDRVIVHERSCKGRVRKKK